MMMIVFTYHIYIYTDSSLWRQSYFRFQTSNSTADLEDEMYNIDQAVKFMANDEVAALRKSIGRAYPKPYQPR